MYIVLKDQVTTNESFHTVLRQIEYPNYEKDISWDEEMACFTSAIENSDNIENGSIEEAMKIMELIEKIYQSDPEWQAKYYQNYDK